ncbi:MAG: hypothetical protein H7318_15885 [Oligoflexus sp.]|nr:hypothetical protein [Oligoflexus sp.]
MERTTWISHRGYCLDAVENTRNSFDAAIKLGFRYLETDLRSTLDGHIVLQHDSSLQKSCHSDQNVETIRLAAIRDLKTHDGQAVLGLPELIQDYSDYNWTFDIKEDSASRTLDLLAQWAETGGPKAQLWLKDHCRFLLWSKASGLQALRLFPQVMRLAQERECYRAGLAVVARVPQLSGIQAGKTYSIPPSFAGFNLFTKATLKAYHSRKARLLAYLPEDDDASKKAYFLGFDEILTNGRRLF